MPGPVALKKREYYGYPHNHFWPIMADLFGSPRLTDYHAKKALLRRHHVALWDVIASCRRDGASDSSIRHVRPNDIPGLLRRRPALRAVFLNGRTAETLFRDHFGRPVDRPVVYLPSTSPAHASMSYRRKLARWRAIKRYL